MKHLLALLSKDMRLDFRQQFGLSGIILYVLGAAFIVYMVFGEMDGRTWVALFWIVILFCSVNAVLKSHTQEDQSRNMYYYTLVDPLILGGAKLLYNFLLLAVIVSLTFIVFSTILQVPIVSYKFFVAGLVLGVIGIAANFTFVSKIASQTRNQSTMMMILSLPVIIPLLLPLVRLSIKSLGPMTWAMAKSDLTLLLAVDLFMMGLVFLLFPFLNRS